jgi:hypothetical protein
VRIRECFRARTVSSLISNVISTLKCRSVPVGFKLHSVIISYLIGHFLFFLVQLIYFCNYSYTRNIFFFFFINWILRMNDNLPERVQILGHAHILIVDFFFIKYFNLICHLILTKINCIALKIRSKADFKSKSQNIWQQIILFSSTLLWRLINFRLFCSDDCRSWPRDEKINNHGCCGKHAHIPDNDYWEICLNANDMRVTQDLNSFGEIMAHAHCLVDEKNVGCK